MGAGLCSYIMEVGVGWGTPISPVSKDTLSQEGKKCPALTYRLAGTTPNKILFESVLPSPRYPTLWSSILQGEGRASGCWDILSVCASEVILWDQDKELGPRLQAGPASREETPLIFFS